MAELKLTDITKYFNPDTPVISNLDLTVNDGEFLVLVGPSGCGKSTILRMLAGLEEPTSGQLYIGSQMVNNVQPKDRNIAMVFQNYALYPHMSVYDNLAFSLKLRKMPASKIQQRVASVTEILELEEYLKRRPKELSGGQRQRVALGRAMVRQPKVFLFDEPLSNLDAKLRVQMRSEIKRLHQRLKTTMIYVTHDQTEAMTMGDRIVILKDGMIQQVGTPLEVYHNPANLFVGSFIGSPAMNLIEGKLTEAGFVSDVLDIPFPDWIKLDEHVGQSVVFGIRPEHIVIGDGIWEMDLVLCEPLGNETILHLEKGEEKLIARVTELNNVEIGRKIKISFRLERAHLFLKESGIRIS
ncbi:MAG: sn-glycerol-3-phosphate ABC transporter ATP-binding protein UgpC [Candidatus Marinimicrobia bacterium]|nr:sn-glycerol-3-phosphate ABC transporter ATP-binding protein UgpC [Candidatus Neomarinimicrobiota bacterium]